MSQEPPEGAERLDHGRPDDAGSQGRKVGKGFALGVLAALLEVPAIAMLGAWLEERANSDTELAGLSGLFFGGIFGLGEAAVAFVVGRRRKMPILGEAANGIVVAVGLAGIAFGICAAAS